MTNLILSTIGAVMRDRRGVTSLEYGVIAAALIAAVTAAMTILSGDLSDAFTTLGNAIKTAF
jgi:Flp pilus assembly pilin Flp